MYRWVWHWTYVAFQVFQGEKCPGPRHRIPTFPIHPTHTPNSITTPVPLIVPAIGDTIKSTQPKNTTLSWHIMIDFLPRIDYLRMELGIFWILGNFRFYFSNFHALFFQISIDGIRNAIPVNSLSTQVIKILGSGSELCILYMIHSDWWW